MNRLRLLVSVLFVLALVPWIRAEHSGSDRSLTDHDPQRTEGDVSQRTGSETEPIEEEQTRDRGVEEAVCYLHGVAETGRWSPRLLGAAYLTVRASGKGDVVGVFLSGGSWVADVDLLGQSVEHLVTMFDISCASVAPFTGFYTNVITLAPTQSGDSDESEEALTTQTFEVRNLDVAEAAGMLREMTGIETIVVDPQARTIVAEASPSTIRLVDSLIKIFDTKQPQDSLPLEIRVFRLEHIGTSRGVTLLRAELQVTEVAHNPDRQRIAVRDTAERLDAAAKLLAEADVASD